MTKKTITIENGDLRWIKRQVMTYLFSGISLLIASVISNYYTNREIKEDVNEIKCTKVDKAVYEAERKAMIDQIVEVKGSIKEIQSNKYQFSNHKYNKK